MKADYRLVLLGDAGVGKTALVMQLILYKFDSEEEQKTIEDEYKKQLHIDGQPCIITFLDTGGGEKYMGLRDGWIKEGDAFILVYSVSSRSSFTHIQSLHDHIRRVQKSSTRSNSQLPSLRSVPLQIMIVANKIDHAHEVSTKEGRTLAEQLECQFAETCAKDYTSIEKACSNFIRRIRRGEQDGRVPGKHHNQMLRKICGMIFCGYNACFGHRFGKLGS